MAKFRVKVKCEEIVEAEDKDEAIDKFLEGVENTPQQTFFTFVSENTTAEEL